MMISLIRALLLYVLIIFAVKMMGKRQISDLQTSELVVTFLISDIAAIPMQNTAQPLLSGIIPIVVLICCEIFFSIFMMKSRRFRRIICGHAVLIINNGKIMQNELKKLRMSAEDLISQLRQMDVFSIEDVAFAIFETNGQMSVLKKSEKQPPDAQTLGIVMPKDDIEAVVISNGLISEFSLGICKLTKDWVYGILQGKNIDIHDVFIMTANKNKTYNIIKKEGC
ncbi:DUF421 domain-containing protein [Clostridia bacterium]|nr:DUF421 domain-containing protein [Clostridia bacterium]